jgi:hypothetical protein
VIAAGLLAALALEVGRRIILALFRRFIDRP